MARSRTKPEFLADGLLVVDKPAALGSTEVLNRVKRLTRPLRLGHTGTLDPFATGVLVLCFNRATKLAGYLLAEDKIYQGVMCLGLTTDTQDLTGRIIDRAPVRVGPEEIAAAAEAFKGAIEQAPPAFSALKRDGEPLYQKARRGEEVETEPRRVVIHRLEITRIDPPRVHFEVHCSKGTYIRSLAHDWGRALGCGGHLEALRRLASGAFSLEQALPLAEVEDLARQGRLADRLIPAAQALPQWPDLSLGQESAVKISRGQALSGAELSGLPPRFLKVGQPLKLTREDGELIALAELALASDGRGFKARPIRVLQP